MGAEQLREFYSKRQSNLYVACLLRIFLSAGGESMFRLWGKIWKDNRMLRDYIIELREILTSESKVNFGVISYGSEGVISFEPVIDKFVNNFPNIKFTSFAAGINAMKKQA